MARTKDNVARTPSERKENVENATEESPDKNAIKEGEALTEEIDRLLDEIEEALSEEDPKKFVENYVQKGGE